MSAASLYAQLMGASFSRLHPAVQRFHQLQGAHSLHGRVRTFAPQAGAARWLALSLGSPRADAEGAIRFELQADPACEVWTRHFPDRRMTSTLRMHHADANPHLREHLGLAQLQFSLTEREGALVMNLMQVRWAGLPCPRWALPEVRAIETGLGDQLHFDVQARWGAAGVIARYQGHLEVPR